MKNYNLRLNTGLLINDQGIEATSYMDLKTVPITTTQIDKSE